MNQAKAFDTTKLRKEPFRIKWTPLCYSRIDNHVHLATHRPCRFIIMLALDKIGTEFGTPVRCRWIRLLGFACLCSTLRSTLPPFITPPGDCPMARFALVLWLASFAGGGALVRRYGTVLGQNIPLPPTTRPTPLSSTTTRLWRNHGHDLFLGFSSRGTTREFSAPPQFTASPPPPFP